MEKKKKMCRKYQFSLNQNGEKKKKKDFLAVHQAEWPGGQAISALEFNFCIVRKHCAKKKKKKTDYY